MLVDVVAVQQHVAQLERALAELHIELLEVELGLQELADAALEHKLQEPLEQEIGHRAALLVRAACREQEGPLCARPWLGGL